MAQVVQAPELRFTQDNQLPVAQMLVEFAGSRDNDPPGQLKVVGWGNLATEIQESYQVGDRLIIQGYLRMNTIDRPEGFKEKRAELTASRIYKADGNFAPMGGTARPSNVVSMESYSRPMGSFLTENYNRPASSPPMESYNRPVSSPAAPPSSEPAPIPNEDLDDIPF